MKHEREALEGACAAQGVAEVEEVGDDTMVATFQALVSPRIPIECRVVGSRQQFCQRIEVQFSYVPDIKVIPSKFWKQKREE
jgi:hypothetical protein